MKRIRFCENCKQYTLNEKCPNCHAHTIQKKSIKFRIDDKFLEYRIKMKRKELEEKGLI